jgi:hypothetical protein
MSECLIGECDWQQWDYKPIIRYNYHNHRQNLLLFNLVQWTYFRKWISCLRDNAENNNFKKTRVIKKKLSAWKRKVVKKKVCGVCK